MADALQQLADTGVSVWLDDLSRARIQSGELAGMVDHSGVAGITTNPTIFARAIGTGAGYEEQVQDLALRGTAVGETVRLLTAWDVRAACDVLQPAATRTGGRDGRVSIEVDPRIAEDAGATLDTTAVCDPPVLVSWLALEGEVQRGARSRQRPRRRLRCLFP